ncbi:MAG: NTF2 fold immunity protein [Ruminococcus sp.]
MFNIKKITVIISLLSAVVMLSACQSSTNNEVTTETTTSVQQSVLNNDGSFSGDIINDESTAREYADLILTNTLQKNKNDYKEIDVSFDKNHNLWIVHYSIDELTLGGDIRIEISKENGKVNKIIFGE